MDEDHVKINSYLCPECHSSTLREHYMSEYRHEWHRCRTCGFMERKTETSDRVRRLLRILSSRDSR